ncbi:MAG: hypothetical protein KC503_33960 [Myxococcales bacterium]|nr:hypothetical protein [Myxococcales bacterium]
MERLDWSHIDSAQRFHGLLNAFFLAELNFADCQPGDPWSGRDRGFDLRFDGTIRFLGGRTGAWMIQAKYTKYDHAKARTHLKRELEGKAGKPGEVQKAAAAGVDYLLVVTQAVLEADYVADLQSLARPDSLREIIVISRQKLEELLLPKRWILYRYFRRPIIPGLQPEHEYRDGAEQLPLADLPYVERKEAERELADAVGGDARVVVLHGAAGAGKTRLLREATARAHSLFPTRQVYFCSRHRPGVDVVADELQPEGRYLIVVDDADRDYVEHVRPFARLVLGAKPDLVLVVGCRPGSTDLLLRQLAADGVHRTCLVGLAPLSKERLEELVQQTTKLDERDRRRLVRAVGGNLFLLSAAVQALQSNEHPLSFASNDNLKRDVLARLAQHADAILRGAEITAPPDLRAVLALLVPFAHTNESERMLASRVLGLDDAAQLDGICELLVEAGSLRAVGHKLRFSADLVGDFVLDARLARGDYRSFVKQVVSPLLAEVPQRVVTNLSHASAVGSGRARQTLAALLANWATEESRKPTPERKQRLDCAIYTGRVAPDETLDFIEATVDAPPPDPAQRRPTDRRELFRRAWEGEDFVDDLSTDDISPALLVVGRHPRLVGRTLDVLTAVPSRVAVGTYDNYKPGQVARSLCSPLEVGPDTIEAALQQAGVWLAADAPSPEQVAIIFAAIGTVLRTTWSFTESDAATVTHGARALPESQAMSTLREHAMALLERGVEHASEAVRLAAIGAADRLGESHPAYKISEIPLESRSATERRAIFEQLGRRLQTESSLAVLHALETTLMTSWLRLRPEADLAEEALGRFEPSVQLRVLRWTIRPWDGFENFSLLRAEAPNEKRWSWWVHRKRHQPRQHEQLVEQFRPLVDDIDDDYRGAVGLVELLKCLVSAGYDGSGQVPPWLWAVAERHTDYLTDLVVGEARQLVPAQFVASLEAVWSHTHPRAFEVAVETFSEPESLSVDEAMWLLRLLVVAPDHPEGGDCHHWLFRLASHSSVSVRESLVDLYLHALKVAPQMRLELFAAALRAGYDARLIDHIWSDIHYQIDKHAPLDMRSLADAVINAFIDCDNEDDRDLPQLLMWCLGGDTTRWLDIIEQRLRRDGDVWSIMQASLGSGAQVTPIEGSGEFATTIERVRSWRDGALIDEVQWLQLGKWLAAQVPAAAIGYARKVVATSKNDALVETARLLVDVPFAVARQVWMDLLRTASSTPHFDAVSRAFVSTASFIGSWSGRLGEDPSEFTARIALLQDVAESARSEPSSIRQAVQSALELVQQRLDFQRMEDEERLDPR